MNLDDKLPVCLAILQKFMSVGGRRQGEFPRIDPRRDLSSFHQLRRLSHDVAVMFSSLAG